MSCPSKVEAFEFTTKFHQIPETLVAPFSVHFAGFKGEDGFNNIGLIRSDPGGFVINSQYEENAEKIYNFQPRRSDVWVATFPKCGTTWTQELVWLLVNNCDYEAAKAPLSIRSPFLEMPYIIPPKHLLPEMKMATPSIEDLEAVPLEQPRVIKTHLPFHLLHPQLIETSKVVYVARNPKDVIVSFYHHHKLLNGFHGFNGDVETFADYFIKDLVAFSPFFPHVLDAWAKRNHTNIHFIFYEDLKKDLRGEISKVAAFLDRSLSKDELEKLAQQLSFQSFRENPAVNWEMLKQIGIMKTDGHFIRKGKTGDWKNHFSPELNERIDQWIEKNLTGSDLKFVTELETQD